MHHKKQGNQNKTGKKAMVTYPEAGKKSANVKVNLCMCVHIYSFPSLFDSLSGEQYSLSTFTSLKT